MQHHTELREEAGRWTPGRKWTFYHNSFGGLMFRCLLVVVMLLLPATQALAEKLEIGDGTTVVGVKSQDFEHFADPDGAGLSKNEHWGWAACLQQILNYHGVYVTQEDLVKKVLGAPLDTPAQLDEIVKGLVGCEFRDVGGGTSTVYLKETKFDLPVMLRDLEYNWPMLVGISSPDQEHAVACVVTAVFFSGDQSNPTLTEIVLRNPAGDGSKLKLSAQEFDQRLLTVLRVYVKRSEREAPVSETKTEPEVEKKEPKEIFESIR